MKGLFILSVGLLAPLIAACPGHGRPPPQAVQAQHIEKRATTSTKKTSTVKTSSTKTSSVKTSSVKTSSVKTSSVKTSSVKTSSVKSSSTKAASATPPPPETVLNPPTFTSTILAASSVSAAAATASATPVADSIFVKSTVLIIARDADSARQASSGLNAYGIPFENLIVPSTGVALPTLNTTAGGNYGGIIALSGIAYEYDGGAWHSAITDDQWNQLYAYQMAYGVRMVQYDVYPQSAFGTTTTASCCGDGVEQLIYWSNTTSFLQAGLNTGVNAGMSTLGLYHYITSITDSSTTWEVAAFAPNSQVSNPSTAAVINNFSGREQMVFFTTWATDWSPTSNYLQHGAITWMTRGLYAGYRRVNINAQIDDMMLGTPIYSVPQGTTEYRVTPADMSDIRDWVPAINAKMNPGSIFKPEIGYNGNGNLIAVDQQSSDPDCQPHPIYTGYSQPADQEFQKPLGTGADLWPSSPTNYTYTSTCLNKDPLSVWFQTPSNRDTFMHISHTFTHEHLDNSTYSDANKEINFNQKWFAQTGIAGADFTSNGLIPPAITGLHNGDVLRAWFDNGLRNCVGDNARPKLRNQDNKMWPVISTMEANGFDGFTIIPRWPLRIYYNCDSPDCTYSEWANTGGGTGGFTNLMLQEKNDMMRYFFGGYREGVMFHQMNLRTQNNPAITTADGTVVHSLYQAWNEQAVQEFTRLANWPMISLKQSQLADEFVNRMTRDHCGYTMQYGLNDRKISHVVVMANGNTCGAEIPITVPGDVADTQGFRTEKIGNDPLTVWVRLSGSPVVLTLATPMAV